MDCGPNFGRPYMRPKDRSLATQLQLRLAKYQRTQALPGINDPRARAALIEQLVESLHRVEYVNVLRHRQFSQERANPHSELFDPIKAAVLHHRAGNDDEAFWLTFLSVHFGKNLRTGWRLLRDVYGRLGRAPWTWLRISADPIGFRHWLASSINTLHGGDGITRRFGNHRKYQSLDAWSPSGTGSALESYVGWIAPPRPHREMFTVAVTKSRGDGRLAFACLYETMRVASFGRTAKFDYLAMVGKLGLAPIEPDRAYLSASTGPLIGTKRLFGVTGRTASPAQLDSHLVQLGAALEVGMQVIEDALCNWQKSPLLFRPFRG